MLSFRSLILLILFFPSLVWGKDEREILRAHDLEGNYGYVWGRGLREYEYVTGGEVLARALDMVPHGLIVDFGSDVGMALMEIAESFLQVGMVSPQLVGFTLDLNTERLVPAQRQVWRHFHEYVDIRHGALLHERPDVVDLGAQLGLDIGGVFSWSLDPRRDLTLMLLALAIGGELILVFDERGSFDLQSPSGAIVPHGDFFTAIEGTELVQNRFLERPGCRVFVSILRRTGDLIRVPSVSFVHLQYDDLNLPPRRTLEVDLPETSCGARVR